MISRRVVRLLFCLLPSAFCLPSHASTDTTALTGRVVIGDAPAADVTVTATSASLIHERTTTTGPRGTYWLDELPPGTYDVTFSHKGTQTLTRRAILELGRIARADARLELSEDEESVTSTATSVNVAETTAITTHFSDEELDRLPIPRRVGAATGLTPIDGVPFVPFVAIDDVGVFSPEHVGEEALQEVSVFRGAVPVDRDELLLGRTRSGGEEFFLSLRGTATHVNGDTRNVIETASGGHVIPEKLWFFAAGSGGDVRGYEVKLTSQLGASHNVAAEVLDTDRTTSLVRYLGTFGDRLAANATASHSGDNALRANASYFLPTSSVDHVLTAGGITSNARDAFYANDRLSFQRFTFDAGARVEDGDTTARIAGAFDVLGDGRRAIIANWTDDVASLGFATALGTTGFARADVIRRDGGNELAVESRYSLFGRLDLGATYLYADRDESQRAAAWAGVQLPIGDHEFGVTLLQRYTDFIAPTDLALRYTIPFTKFGLTIAGDVTNILQREGERALRLWLRLRFR